MNANDIFTKTGSEVAFLHCVSSYPTKEHKVFYQIS